jgi:hypothetical protein
MSPRRPKRPHGAHIIQAPPASPAGLEVYSEEVDWTDPEKSQAPLDAASRPERFRQILALYAHGASIRSMLMRGKPISRTVRGISAPITPQDALEDLRRLEQEAMRLFDRLVQEAAEELVVNVVATMLVEQARGELFLQQMSDGSIGMVRMEAGEEPDAFGRRCRELSAAAAFAPGDR